MSAREDMLRSLRGPANAGDARLNLSPRVGRVREQSKRDEGACRSFFGRRASSPRPSPASREEVPPRRSAIAAHSGFVKVGDRL